MANITGILITGRYEHAILIQKNREDTINAVFLVIILASFFSLLLGGIVFCLGKEIAILIFHSSSMAYLLYFLPLAVFSIGCSQGLIYWATQKADYKTMASARVSRSAAASALQCLMGSLGTAGLVAGHCGGEIACVGVLFKGVRKEKALFGKTVQWKRILDIAKRHIDFPKYDILTVLLNYGTQHFFLLWIGIYFGASIVGHVGLAQRVLLAPVAFVGTSILDLFKKKARDEYTSHGHCRKVFRNFFFILAALVTVPFSIIFFYGEQLFPLIFGPEWMEAGKYAKILSLIMLFRFVASPLSYTLYIAQKQKVNLLINILFCIASLAAVMVGVFTKDIVYTLLAFATGNSLVYLLYLKASHHFASGQHS